MTAHAKIEIIGKFLQSTLVRSVHSGIDLKVPLVTLGLSSRDHLCPGLNASIV